MRTAKQWRMELGALTIGCAAEPRRSQLSVTHDYYRHADVEDVIRSAQLDAIKAALDAATKVLATFGYTAETEAGALVRDIKPEDVT